MWIHEHLARTIQLPGWAQRSGCFRKVSLKDRNHIQKLLREFPWLWGTKPCWYLCGDTIEVKQATMALLRQPAEGHTVNYWVLVANDSGRRDVGLVKMFPLAGSMLPVLALERLRPFKGLRMEIRYIVWQKRMEPNYPGHQNFLTTIIRPPAKKSLQVMCEEAATAL
ncbi:MAG TPA: hypothetical protein VFQ72_01700 [Candidatus Paceibacterota bacterium]|nr:hypothetical protein [Candidatus Paceibacterota bacterium]